jgi:hypothetical protein
MPPTVIRGDFEWEDAKAKANLEKHDGVSFEEAATALADPGVVVFDDESGPGVLKAVGNSRRGRLLTVAHEVRGDRERIISAWKATREERRLYMARGA